MSNSCPDHKPRVSLKVATKPANAIKTLTCIPTFKNFGLRDNKEKIIIGDPRNAGIKAVILAPPDLMYPNTPKITNAAP